MEVCATRLREALVGDLARQRVLERVLGLALERRARAPADEVAIFEDAEIRSSVLEQLVDRPGPEDAADHRRRLERRLVGRLEQVDARREDCLDGIGPGE